MLIACENRTTMDPTMVAIVKVFPLISIYFWS